MLYFKRRLATSIIITVIIIIIIIIIIITSWFAPYLENRIQTQLLLMVLCQIAVHKYDGLEVDQSFNLSALLISGGIGDLRRVRYFIPNQSPGITMYNSVVLPYFK